VPIDDDNDVDPWKIKVYSICEIRIFMRFQVSTTVNISFVIFVIRSCGWTGSYCHFILSSNNKPLIGHL
jgi:hypothetical protein